MDVLDTAGRELDYFDGIGACDDEVSDVEADARLRPDQQPLDLLRALDRAAETGLDRELEPVAGADVLNRTDEVEQVRPLRVGERIGPRRAWGSLRDGGNHQRAAADGGQPVRVAVDVRELGPAGLVVMEDRLHLTGNDLEPGAPEQCLGVVAAGRQEGGRTGGDRPLADGRGFGEHPLGVDLVAPVASLVDAPAGGRKGKPGRRAGTPPPKPTPAPPSPGNPGGRINLLVNGCPARLFGSNFAPPPWTTRAS